MRNISSGLLATLQSDGMRIAVCCLLTRTDGTVFGFTSWDSDLVIGGVTYEHDDAVTGSNLSQESGDSVDNLEIVGLLQSDRITDADLAAGRYDNATLKLFMVTPDNLTYGSMILMGGLIGEVTIKNGQFVAEVRSFQQRLGQSIGDLTCPTCRVKRLGDSQCTVNVAAFQTTATVASVSTDGTVLTISGITEPSGWYNEGLILMQSGNSNGIEEEIANHIYASGTCTIALQEPYSLGVAVGDACRLEAGCDRLWATCQDKFSNSVNFRGEPFVPGQDQVLQVGRG